MPVVTVYTWGPTLRLVGHSSMQLSDGTYISWWPSSNDCSLQNPECSAWQPSSYSEDYSNEGGRHGESCCINITGAEERKIKEWWDIFKRKQYHFLKNNCSTAIFHALKEVYPGLEVFANIDIWVPKAINMIAEDLANGKRSFDYTRAEEVRKAAVEEAMRIAKIGAVKFVGWFSWVFWRRHCSIM